MGAEVNETARGCGPGAGACSRQFCVSCASRGGGAATEPPRDGRTPGATALVGAYACLTNMERQRAAQRAVSCPLPAPVGYNLAPWWLPRKINGGPGRGGIGHCQMPVSRPRRRFAYFADVGKVGRPQAKYPPSLARRRNSYIQFRDLTKRADHIRPYGEGTRRDG